MAVKHSTTLSYVRDRVNYPGAQGERRALEQLWFSNLAYYAGFQHHIAGDGTIRAPALDPNRVHHSANFIAPAVLRAISKIQGANIDARIPPKSAERVDVQAAKVSRKILEHIRIETEWEEKKADALLDAAIYGAGFLKVTWDPMSGTPTRVYFDSNENRVPRVDLSDEEKRDREERGLYRDAFEGEITVSIPSIFEMKWDTTSQGRGIDGCSWVAQEHSVSIEELVDRYGSDLRRVGHHEEDAGSLRYRRAIATLSAGLMRGIPVFGGDGEGEDTAVVTEYFERPGDRNKWKGRYILVAGETVVRDEPNGYAAFGCPIPFVKLDWWPCNGKFISLSLVEQLRSPQRAYNRSVSHQIEVERTNGYPTTILPTGSNVKPIRLQSFPGLVLEANLTAGQPFVAQPPNLPAYIGQNADRRLYEIGAISATAAPVKEQLPAQVRSALAIQAIQEENNAILAPTAHKFAKAVKLAARMMLQIASKKYDFPRLVRTVGRGGDFEVEYFSAADMRGHTDVVIVGEPGRLESSTAYAGRVMEMVELGVLDLSKEEDRVAALKAIDSRTADQIVSDNLADETSEEKWLRRMIENPGFIPPLLGVENPNVRAKVLERFIKRDEFWEIDPRAQQAIMARWQAFSQLIQQQLAAQLQMAQMASGGAAPKGTPSRPKRATA